MGFWGEDSHPPLHQLGVVWGALSPPVLTGLGDTPGELTAYIRQFDCLKPCILRTIALKVGLCSYFAYSIFSLTEFHTLLQSTDLHYMWCIEHFIPHRHSKLNRSTQQGVQLSYVPQHFGVCRNVHISISASWFVGELSVKLPNRAGAEF